MYVTQVVVQRDDDIVSHLPKAANAKLNGLRDCRALNFVEL